MNNGKIEDTSIISNAVELPSKAIRLTMLIEKEGEESGTLQLADYPTDDPNYTWAKGFLKE